MKPNLCLFNSLLLLLCAAPGAIAADILAPLAPPAPEGDASTSSQPPTSAQWLDHTIPATSENPAPQLLRTSDLRASDLRTSDAQTSDPVASALQKTAQIQEEPEEPEEEVTVTGTRSPRPVQQSPGSVTVIDDQEIDKNLVRDLRDLVRYEPGVSVRNNVRFGFQDINIRGIEGNRVLIQVDGTRLPSAFNLGPFSLGRDFQDLETLKAVEVLRGPGSTLYGSDALGGVVTFVTIDPKDLLDRVGKNWYVGGSHGFSSQNTGFVNSLSLAGRSGPMEGVFIYTRRDFQESLTNGDTLFRDDQTGNSNNYFGKLVYRINPANTLKFSVEALDRTVETDIATANLASETGAPAGFPLRTRAFATTLDTNRTRLGLSYEFKDADSPIIQLAKAQIYYQTTESRELNAELRQAGPPVPIRPTAPITLVRNGNNTFLENLTGGDIQLESNFRTGSVKHRLTYGLEASTQRNERRRDKVQTNLITGAQTRNAIPDNFPAKDFPDSDTTRFGFYLQNEIALAGGKFTLFPGIRYDVYDLKTSSDADYFRNGSPPPVDFSDSAVSPKLGFVWQASPQLAVFGQYARGFRAPLYSEINSGFANTTSFPPYRTIPNPDLKAETSDGFELGVRGRFPRGRFSVAGFYNAYSNFIESLVQTSAPGVFPLVFQTQNVSKARIYGIEASGEYRFSPKEHGFSAFASLAYTVGDDLTQDIPLRTIDPFRAVLGLRYRAMKDKWGAELYTTIVASPRVAVTATRPNPFVPSGYATVDFIGYYNVTDSLRLNAGVFNLFNSSYYQYSDVRNFNQGDARVDRFAQPGINVGLNVSWRF